MTENSSVSTARGTLSLSATTVPATEASVAQFCGIVPSNATRTASNTGYGTPAIRKNTRDTTPAHNETTAWPVT